MPLDPFSLALGLRDRWLPGAGSFAASVAESGQRFTAVVAPWFAAGAAAGMPCTTAIVRQSGLAGDAGGALASGTARAAGQRLALAVAQFFAGQTFGPGMSGPPAATPALTVALGEVFASHDLDGDRRATLIATAIWATALTTIVVFPPPLTPAPVV